MGMNKFCPKCNETKTIEDFNKKKNRPDGLYNFCRICQKIENKITYEKNRENRLIKAKQYYENNKNNISVKNELIKEKRAETFKEWYNENKEYNIKRNKEYKEENKDILRQKKNIYYKNNIEKMREYGRNRLKNNPLVKLAKSCRGRISEALKHKGHFKNKKFEEYIGCTKDELKIYIEKQFKDGMNWEKVLSGEVHIDHIVPLSKAETEEQIYKLCHHTNLQPLWELENLKKNNKLIYEVKPIDKILTYNFLLNIHYAKRIPIIVFSFGLYANSELVGVITYGKPAAPNIAKSLVGDEYKSNVYELSRLCLKNNLKNEASILISKSLKLLPKNSFILSFADSGQNHIGYVYQATNFKYYGQTNTKSEIALKSKPNSHSLGIYDESKGKEDRIGFLKQKYGDDLYWKKRSAKHRYVYVVGNKDLYLKIKYKEHPYPKK